MSSRAFNIADHMKNLQGTRTLASGAKIVGADADSIQAPGLITSAGGGDNTSLNTGLASATYPAGMVLNVQQAVKNGTQQVTSQTYILLSGLTIDITPKSSSSKFLIEYHVNGNMLNDLCHGYLQLYRDGSAITGATADSSGTDSLGSRTGATSVINTGGSSSDNHMDGAQLTYSMKYLDSPSTTSQLTYAVYCKSSNGHIIYINRSGRDNDAAAFDGRTISTLTIMEIQA